jgi:hypothetical protein
LEGVLVAELLNDVLEEVGVPLELLETPKFLFEGEYDFAGTELALRLFEREFVGVFPLL